ncbi:folate-binding protein YgfZ [Microbacterium sp. W4I20]|nr:hypothetical protein [Microbacterium sp. W4I20]MDQ0728646.1 folate-binding protein YgfZ [Microbacterium sp. W4I20]
MAVFESIEGAVAGELGTAHFGDPFREQRRLAAGDAIAPLEDRTVIEVSGPERLAWLDSITSQSVGRLAAGDSTELLVLDPQGRVEHAAGVVDDGSTTWLIADAADAEGLATWLTRMKFRTQATVELRPDLVLFGYVDGGSAARAVHAAASSDGRPPLVWEDPWQHVAVGGHQYSEIVDHPGAALAWRIGILSAAEAEALSAAVDQNSVAGLLAAEALRIAAWRPRWAAEVDDRSLPHESDWLRTAVHLSKGCYRGQETVAKVHNLGHPPRRLAALQLDGSEGGAAGTRLARVRRRRRDRSRDLGRPSPRRRPHRARHPVPARPDRRPRRAGRRHRDRGLAAGHRAGGCRCSRRHPPSHAALASPVRSRSPGRPLADSPSPAFGHHSTGATAPHGSVSSPRRQRLRPPSTGQP